MTFSAPFSNPFSDRFLEGLFVRLFRQNVPTWCPMVPTPSPQGPKMEATMGQKVAQNITFSIEVQTQKKRPLLSIITTFDPRGLSFGGHLAIRMDPFFIFFPMAPPNNSSGSLFLSLSVLLTDLGPHFDPQRGPLGLTFSRFFRVWTPLGPYWPPLGPLVPLWVPFWTLWASFWYPFGPFGLHFRALWVLFSTLVGCAFQQKKRASRSVFQYFPIGLWPIFRRLIVVFSTSLGQGLVDVSISE